MPTVQPPAKVLVSGANGFVAIWVIKALLDQGYAVRGTVRSLEKGNHLKKVFDKYGDKLELVVVADIAEVNYLGPMSGILLILINHFRRALSTKL
jgi:nucleoside-diphosphate-sugar epimerase